MLRQKSFCWCVSFTDSSNSTAVGELGTIIRTNDGVKNWIAQSSGTTTTLRGVSFTDANNGWIVGYEEILNTKDDGNNRNIQTTQAICGGGYLYAVYFVNSNDGTAVGDGKIIHSTVDGGNNWKCSTFGNVWADEFYGVYFTDPLNGWVVGNSDGGTIYHSTNGGVTFVKEEKIINEIQKDYCLYQNYPNPFNPTTT